MASSSCPKARRSGFCKLQSQVVQQTANLLVAAMNAMLGADTLGETEWWTQEMLDWLRRYLRLPTAFPPIIQIDPTLAETSWTWRLRCAYNQPKDWAFASLL